MKNNLTILLFVYYFSQTITIENTEFPILDDETLKYLEELNSADTQDPFSLYSINPIMLAYAYSVPEGDKKLIEQADPQTVDRSKAFLPRTDGIARKLPNPYYKEPESSEDEEEETQSYEMPLEKKHSFVCHFSGCTFEHPESFQRDLHEVNCEYKPQEPEKRTLKTRSEKFICSCGKSCFTKHQTKCSEEAVVLLYPKTPQYHGKGDYSCPTCNKKFTYGRSFSNHLEVCK